MELIRTKVWYERQPNPLAFLSCFIALNADFIYALLTSIKGSQEFKQTVKIEKPLIWYRLYRNHRKIVSTFIDIIREISNQHNIDKEVINSLKEEFSSPQPFSSPRPPKPLRKYILGFFRPKDLVLFNFIKSMIEEKQDDSKSLAEWKKLNSVPEIAFIVTVLIPCWFEYRELMTPLLRRARQGDLESLEKILRLDKNAIHDPKIAKELHIASQKPQGIIYRRLTNAMANQTRTKLTPERVKIWMSGLILLISEILQCKLTTPEIRKLFDALSYDLNGDLYDSEITLEEDAFRMAVNREKDFWRPFIKDVGKLYLL